jgi:Cu/Ag efflux protein CusF
MSMVRFIRFMLVIVLLATPIVALGAEVQGKVKTIDTSDRVVTLEDGTRISVPDGIALDNVKEGAEITVSYEERDGKNQATDIQMK